MCEDRAPGLRLRADEPMLVSGSGRVHQDPALLRELDQGVRVDLARAERAVYV